MIRICRTVLLFTLILPFLSFCVLAQANAAVLTFDNDESNKDSTSNISFKSSQNIGLDRHPLSDLTFAISSMGMEQGLPQNTVNDILQSADGYMWLATFGGLVRFDGNRFTTFNRSTHSGFQFDRILKLHEDAQGGIWMMAENAQTVFIRFFEGKFTSYLIKVGQMSVSPVSMVNDEEGRLWVSAFNTIYRFSDDEFVEIPVKKSVTNSFKELVKKNGALITNNESILITSGDSVAIELVNLGGIIENQITDVTEYPQGSGQLFVSAFSNGILRLNVRGGDEISVSNENAPNPIFRFKKDKRGNLFGRHFGGMTIWNGRDFVPFYPFDEAEKIQITNVHEDTEGNYWIGTFSKGLFRLRPTAISMIDRDEGLENERMLSLTELSDGTLLFGTNCGGFYEWNNQQLRYSDLNSSGIGTCGWAVFQDSKQRIWLGSHGLFRAENLKDEPELFMPGSWINDVGIFAITEDQYGRIWISTADGLARFDEQTGELHHFTTKDGLYFNDSRALLADESGFMWVGTKAGLNRIKNNTVERYVLVEETATGQIPQQPYIRAFHKDSTDALWIGTYGDGIFRLKNGRIDHITRENGLFDDIVSHLIPDRKGNFWMGSNRGISRVRIHDLNQFFEGAISRIDAVSYGARDGMNSAETNGGFQPNFVQDSKGQIYLPTVAGVAVISAGNVSKNSVPPPVFIEDVKTIDSTLSLNDDLTISHNTPYLEINYTAVNFAEPKKVSFKYKLVGLDDHWITVGNARKAIYSKIPAGEYRFHVLARNDHGVWNNTGASIGIYVTPPFWQRWWFYTLSGLFLLGLAGTALYRREQKFQRETERQKRFTEQLIESQEQERRRIANELHDSLGQQILVIKNRAELAQLQVDDRKELLEQLKEITGSAVQSIENVRSISHGLRPVHLEKFGLTESLENLCDQVMQSSSIDWSYQIDKVDDIFEERKVINFYRIVQEGITNILRHSEATEASVFVRRSDEVVNVKLWDNGKGINKQTQKMSNGLGFLGMNERSGTLGGHLDVQSEPGNGTTITLTIPLQKS